MNKKEYDININVKETAGNDVFSKTYRIALRDTFVKNKNPKEHNLQNHVEGMLTQLKLNSLEPNKLQLAKWHIHAVNYAIGTGSEILSIRPSIIYKNSKYTKGDDVIVIPLTSAVQNRLTDSFDIHIKKDDKNHLFQDSFARLRQMRVTSLNRVGKLLGIVTDEVVKREINTAVQEMLGFDE